ncbi:MAG: UbiA family prenyltransferase [Pirellulaceae bacterium]|nr:UbiA family prenyltransferase [Pirellulaceae bacterium]
MIRDWLELIRVPNVFTAIADVTMGYFVVTRAADFDASAGLTLGLLIAASSLLYSAGMVLNDVFDHDEDCRDRPDRPLPSGRISHSAASRLGWGLLAGGAAATFLVSFLTARWGALICGVGLCVLIWKYNATLKRHAVPGPLALGACRFLNVLLGMSVVELTINLTPIAAVIGLYIVGVSIMARREADVDDSGTVARGPIVLGMALSIAAVASLAWLPDWLHEQQPILVRPGHWQAFVLVMSLLAAWRFLRALVDPRPGVVQGTVGQGIAALIVLDAGITLAVAGIGPGLAVLALIVPNTLLRRWFYQT